jgi:purine nucleoside permease
MLTGTCNRSGLAMMLLGSDPRLDLTQNPENWCKLYTGGKADFVMTECEDQSIAYALYTLGRAHRRDPRRYLVLRTASNYCEPPPGVTVLDSLLHSGELLAVESAYRVGAPVVHELVQHWDRYATELPKPDVR